MPTYTPHTYTFTATPLTPIHVGTGETLDTSRYLLVGDRWWRSPWHGSPPASPARSWRS